MSETIIDLQTTLCYLDQERTVWMDARDRDNRAGGNDGVAKRARGKSMERMDEHLEDYFVLIGAAAIRAR